MLEKLLRSRRILLAEDDYFIVQEMAQAFEESGAEVIGPVSNVPDALELIEQTAGIDGAVLDVNLQGEMVFPVADKLNERGIPFLFSTGYSAAAIPPRYAHVARCEKPVDPTAVGRALFSK